MNKRIFPGPPKAAGAKKLKTEFERFDALAKHIFASPKKRLHRKEPVKRRPKT